MSLIVVSLSAGGRAFPEDGARRVGRRDRACADADPQPRCSRRGLHSGALVFRAKSGRDPGCARASACQGLGATPAGGAFAAGPGARGGGSGFTRWAGAGGYLLGQRVATLGSFWTSLPWVWEDPAELSELARPCKGGRGVAAVSSLT